MKKQNNIIYIRATVAIIVVLGHVIDLFLGDGYYAEKVIDEYGILNSIHQYIISFHMPVFMSVSGYLFFFEINKEDDNWGKALIIFLKKKINRLIIPFIIIMYFIRKPVFYILGYESIKSDGVHRVIDYLKFSTTGHLWFLYVLFIIFAFHFIFKRIIWNNKIFEIFFLLVSAIVSIYSQHRLNGTIHHILYYNLFFVLGVFCHLYYDTFICKLLRYRYYVWVIDITFKILYLLNTNYDNLILNILLCISSCLDIISIYLLVDFLNEKPLNKIIEYIDDKSMGIYLFHPIVISIYTFCVPYNNFFFSFMGCFVVSVICSIIITILVRNYNLKGILGER